MISIFVLLGLVLSASALPQAIPVDQAVANELIARGILDFLSNFAQNVLLPPIVTAVQDSAALLAQVTAGVHQGGLDSILGLLGVGKREIGVVVKGAWTDLFNVVVSGVSNQIYDAANQLTSHLGLTLTQILAQIAAGKRDADEFRGIWDDLLNTVSATANGLVQQVVQQVQTQGLSFLLQILAQNGKRQATNPLQNILGSLSQALQQQINQILEQVVQPAIQQAVQTASGMLAQITASVAVGGLPAAQGLLGSLLGNAGVGY
jgi:hypothetical protein